MATLIYDRALEEDILAQRKAWGADKYDEVWDGVYIVSPMPNNEHQELVSEFTYVLRLVALPGDRVLPGCNVSDRDAGWEHNYRVPDVAVFLAGTAAKNKDTYWLGGPDLFVEIESQYDRIEEKLPFYGKIGARELLVVRRDPWAMELYQGDGQKLTLMGRSTIADGNALTSSVLPLVFRLVAGDTRPKIEARHAATGQTWLM